MRCRACDAALNDEEATRKDPHTGEYPDLCDPCGGIVAADLAEDDIPMDAVEGIDLPEHFEQFTDDFNN